MKRYLIAYAVMLVLFPVLDFIWIGFVARGLYQGEIGSLLAPQPRLAPAAGVLIFAVAPGLDRDDWARAFGMAVLFGAVAYAVYDLTNLSILKGFTLKISLADMTWGALMTGVAGSLGRVAARRFG